MIDSLNLLPQLDPSYKVCLLKNEFGDLAIDSQLSQASSIAGVTELLNGCICCNLIGSISESLIDLRDAYNPDRIVIETSGSAFPATLAMEIQRVASQPVEEGKGGFSLDGTILVVDVENWKGYEDTSYTAKLQAKYTDLVVMNKWEDVSERKLDDAIDRIRDLNDETPWIKSQKGRVDASLIFGIEGGKMPFMEDNHHDHTSEVDVLSITLPDKGCIKKAEFRKLLNAPKDEVYRMKGVFHERSEAGPVRYVLNWAFGRHTLTPIEHSADEPALRMTMILSRGEGNMWKRKLESGTFIQYDVSEGKGLEVNKVA